MHGRSWLVWELTAREVSQRYRGTVLGVVWPVLYSLLFLAVFALVFGIVLQVRWPAAQSDASLWYSTLMIFAGLVPYFVIAEVFGRSPNLIIGSQNLVKRARFPLHLISVVAVNAAMFVGLINVLFLLLLASLLHVASLNSWAIVPLMILPLYLFSVGTSWLLSSLALFFRDLAHIAPVLLQVMMFLSPVFYPMDVVPGWLRPFLLLNPLTYFVEGIRSGLSGTFDAGMWVWATAASGLFCVAGALIFRRLRPAFADVV